MEPTALETAASGFQTQVAADGALVYTALITAGLGLIAYKWIKGAIFS